MTIGLLVPASLLAALKPTAPLLPSTVVPPQLSSLCRIWLLQLAAKAFRTWVFCFEGCN